MKRFFCTGKMAHVFLFLLIAYSHEAFSVGDPKVTIYPAPSDEVLSKDYTLEVNGQPVDIYLAKI
ncbi:MAG TPA: hypothetical protein VIS27_05540, partial [Yeosuana sp.]